MKTFILWVRLIIGIIGSGVAIRDLVLLLIDINYINEIVSTYLGRIYISILFIFTICSIIISVLGSLEKVMDCYEKD